MPRPDRLSIVKAMTGVFFATVLSCGQSARESARRLAVDHSAAPIESQVADAHSTASATPRLKAQVVAFQEAENVPRRIIYEATISLIVKDASAIEAQI